MNQFITADTPQQSYLTFPRFLLELRISETAKLLYIVLLDRARLSARNAGWTDERGRVFLIYTIRDLAAALHRSEATVKVALNVLTAQDLVFRQRQKIGSPSRIFVKLPSSTDEKPAVQQPENKPPHGRKTSACAAGNLATNKKEPSKKEIVKPESKTPAAIGRYANVFLTDEEREGLRRDFPDWLERVEHLSAYMASAGKTYRSHAATIRLWAAKDRPAPGAAARRYDCGEEESL